jgi:hypothetical protein
LFGISFEFWAAKGGGFHATHFSPSSCHHAVHRRAVNRKTEAGAETFNIQHSTPNTEHQTNDAPIFWISVNPLALFPRNTRSWTDRLTS